MSSAPRYFCLLAGFSRFYFILRLSCKISLTFLHVPLNRQNYANMKDLKNPRAAIGEYGNGDEEGDGALESSVDAGDESSRKHKRRKRKFSFKKEAKKQNAGHDLSPNLEDQVAAFQKAVRTSSKVILAQELSR